MKKINVKRVKVGKSYFFTNNYFEYPDLFRTSIRLEKIYRIIGSDFSTKNDGDEYEHIRFFGFNTENDAKKYLIKQIKERVKDIIIESKKAIKLLETPSQG